MRFLSLSARGLDIPSIKTVINYDVARDIHSTLIELVELAERVIHRFSVHVHCVFVRER